MPEISSSETRLTPRQQEVLERIGQRRTLKEIAAALGLSESAVNQHVRELKRKLAVNSLSELAHRLRDEPGLLESPTCRESTSIKSHMAQPGSFLPEEALERPVADPVSVTFADAAWSQTPPWVAQETPQVVPRVLDGNNAGWVRTAAMALIVTCFFVAVVVGLGAVQGLTALTSEWSDPVPKQRA